jgi:uncharacterized protein YndB with AHSA1/START domain
MRLDVSLEVVLPHSIDEVWSVLTDGAAISEWLMEAIGFEPRVGARFRLRTQNLARSGWIVAEVLALDPPRRMVWSWTPDGDGPASSVTFSLTSEPGGTRLALAHTGETDPTSAGLLRGGWPTRIELIRRSLDRTSHSHA